MISASLIYEQSTFHNLELKASCCGRGESQSGDVMIQQLFIVTDIALNLLAVIQKRYPYSRVAFWDTLEPDLIALKRATQLATCVVAENEITEQVSEVVGRKVIPLSQYDGRLARWFDKAAGALKGKTLLESVDDVFQVDNGPILFCPSNDTHVKMFEPISNFLSHSNFLLFDDRPTERAEQVLNVLGVKYQVGGPETLAQMKPSVVVVGNDWYAKGQALLEEARSLRIPTVCIQEGCLDFEKRQRMQWCDYPFVQGPIMLKYLNQKMYFITGNPRFDNLHPNGLTEQPVVMINSNFTYGIHEDQRDSWITDVVQACKDIGVEFFISQHPRDAGKFPGLPMRRSGAEKIHQHLAESAIVVTRFSTIVYEAMLSGRRVVYYNPHGEDIRLFNEDETGGLCKVYDNSVLAHTIQQTLNPLSVEQQNKFELFLDFHCGARDGRAARRCASALSYLSQEGYPLSDNSPYSRFRFWVKRKLKQSVLANYIHSTAHRGKR